MDSELSWNFFKREPHCSIPGVNDEKISWFNKFIIVLIILNCIAFILETFEPISSSYGTFLNYFEAISVIIFTVEYGLRVWSSGLNPQHKGIIGHLKYIITPFAIIDLLSFLPYYLQLTTISIPFLIPDGRFFRTLRLIRIAKVFKYSESAITLKNVIISKKDDLVVTFMIGLLLLFISSSLMYYYEHDAPGQDKFGNIFDAMYWGIVPLTTVGYGDVLPVTAEGKLISTIITVICITLLALPTGIISEGFIEEKKRMKEECTIEENGDSSPILNNKIDRVGTVGCDGGTSIDKNNTLQCPHCKNAIEISLSKS